MKIRDKARLYLLSALKENLHGVFVDCETPYDLWEAIKVKGEGPKHSFSVFTGILRASRLKYDESKDITLFFVEFEQLMDNIISSLTIIPPNKQKHKEQMDICKEIFADGLRTSMMATPFPPEIVSQFDTWKQINGDDLNYEYMKKQVTTSITNKHFMLNNSDGGDSMSTQNMKALITPATPAATAVSRANSYMHCTFCDIAGHFDEDCRHLARALWRDTVPHQYRNTTRATLPKTTTVERRHATCT